MTQSARRLLAAAPSWLVLVCACGGQGGPAVASTTGEADLAAAGTTPIGTSGGAPAEVDSTLEATTDGEGGSGAGPVEGTVTLLGSSTPNDGDGDGRRTGAPAYPEGWGGMPTDGDVEGVAGQPASAAFGGMPSGSEVVAAAGVAADWPDEVPNELEACELHEGYMSDEDSCVAVYGCDDSRRLEVECDGENDGTDTSLCTCWNNGERIDAVDELLFPTETYPACIAAAVVCIEE